MLQFHTVEPIVELLRSSPTVIDCFTFFSSSITVISISRGRLSISVRNSVNALLRFFDLELRRVGLGEDLTVKDKENPCEIPPEIWDLMLTLYKSNLTMVSLERLIATANAVMYVCKNNFLGAFVECGVWRGGNAILAAKIFEYFERNNKVYLYDTFEGMVPPSEKDFSSTIGSADLIFSTKLNENEKWCYASLDEVTQNFCDFDVKLENVIFVKGNVTQTLNSASNLPDEIAILRLDTDWYESTKYEMETLFPLVMNRGIVMFDDYGFWGGHREAIDEYFLLIDHIPHLNYVDESCRLIIKQNL
jgi:O-methyltransferase